MLSKIKEQEEFFEANKEVESIKKMNYCEKNLTDFLNLFKVISGQISDVHYKYEVRFKESINEVHNYPKLETLKHKVKIRK